MMKEKGAAKCVHCGGGMMDRNLARFNRGFGIAFLILGILLSLFLSMPIGLPVVLVGAYLGCASRTVWMCRDCGAIVDRAKVSSEA